MLKRLEDKMKKSNIPYIFSIVAIITIIIPVFLLIDNNYAKEAVYYHYEIEIFEWILFAIILPSINILLWRNKTMGSKKQKWEEHVTYKTYKKAIINNKIFFITTPILLALIIFTPNNWGWLNHISYVNTKVFIGAIFTTALTVYIIKHSIGRKRPDFDERVKYEYKIEEGYFSFISAYAALAFCSAIFFSLFTIEHYEIEPIFKSGIVLFLVLTAMITSVFRITDNKSHSEDVLAGAFLGSIIGFLFYATPNDWFGQVYTRISELSYFIQLLIYQT